MNNEVCYLGDDDVSGAAIYLCGIMNHFGIAYDHVPSTCAVGPDLLERPYSLYVFSDYPRENLTEEQMRTIAGHVREGAGLAMFGGWESYHGLIGEYNGTPLAEVLPVEMRGEDDRQNCWEPCLIRKEKDHEILEGLPFDTPAGIGGFNVFRSRPDSDLLLSSVRHRPQRVGAGFEFQQGAEAPLLVTGSYGAGRTLALATDVAPHWVGGLVDWGDERVTSKVGEGFIEVGNWYAQFFRNILVWAGCLTVDK